MTEMTPGRILVVDDNEMNRDMLSRRLERQGYVVSIAENGLRALELMQESPFDLVLLDIMMPRMTGYEVLEHVKADSVLRDIPIIMISAVDDLDSVVRCIELGAEDYLFKPFNPVLLKARIGASLDKKRARYLAGGEGLRQPIAALEAGLETLIAGEVGPLSGEQVDLLNHLLTELAYMRQLIG